MAERPEIHWDMVMREQFRTESDRACVILMRSFARPGSRDDSEISLSTYKYSYR